MVWRHQARRRKWCDSFLRTPSVLRCGSLFLLAGVFGPFPSSGRVGSLGLLYIKPRQTCHGHLLVATPT